MEKISEALQAKKIKKSELPEYLKNKVFDLQELITVYNRACDEYEEEDGTDLAVERKLDEQEDYIARTENEIANEIKNIPEHKKEDKSNVSFTGSTDEPKKDSSIGWLIFGGAALILTFGMVNVLKKK
jgi:hypothetical protein